MFIPKKWLHLVPKWRGMHYLTLPKKCQLSALEIHRSTSRSPLLLLDFGLIFCLLLSSPQYPPYMRYGFTFQEDKNLTSFNLVMHKSQPTHFLPGGTSKQEKGLESSGWPSQRGSAQDRGWEPRGHWQTGWPRVILLYTSLIPFISSPKHHDLAASLSLTPDWIFTSHIQHAGKDKNSWKWLWWLGRHTAEEKAHGMGQYLFPSCDWQNFNSCFLTDRTIRLKGAARQDGE